MRAALLTALPSDHLAVTEVPDPQPAPDELLLDVLACGICGTDLHIVAGHSYRPALPFILGHEPVGRVIAAGSQADAHWVGQRVTITLFVGDGTCAWCLAGDERLCPGLVSVTGVVGANGGFAERLVVRTAQVIPVPEALSNDVAAGLVDAGATAANCVRVSSGAAAPITVVLGGGPVGFLAAELLRMDGRPVLVVESNARRREALAHLGHDVVDRADALDIQPGIVIDAAGDPSLVGWALDALEPHGTYVLGGYGTVDSLDLAPAARKELSVLGVRSGRREDLERVMLLASQRHIHVPDAESWALGDIDDAFRALRGGQVAGKAVIESWRVSRPRRPSRSAAPISSCSAGRSWSERVHRPATPRS